MAVVHAAAAPNPAAGPPREYDFTAPRGPHHRIVETTVETRDADGNPIQRPSRYVEVATGMNYFENGAWKASEEKIEPHPEGAAALKGYHKVIFKRNLNQRGAIKLITSDGQELKNHPLGLYYVDRASGNWVKLSGIKNSVGEIIGPNQVIYRNAGDSIRLDLRYTYERGRFHADWILRERPPTPADFGLSADTSLEVVTEFVDAPEPQQRQRVVRQEGNAAKRAAMAEPDITDVELDFAGSRMIVGQAYPIGGGLAPRGPKAVTKQWRQMGARRLLTERVEVNELETLLAFLPPARVQNQPASNGARSWPDAPIAPGPDGPMPRTLPGAESAGVVLDYTTVAGGTYSGYTFSAGATYYLTGSVTVNNGTCSFGNGAVLKYSVGASLLLSGEITISGGGATLTAKDDNSIGEIISGSTGNPSGTYADPAVWLYFTDSSKTVASLTIRHAATAIKASANSSPAISHTINSCSFAQCATGVSVTTSTNPAVTVTNPTFCNVTDPYDPDSIAHSGDNTCPTISDTPNQTINEDNGIIVYFTVGDTETSAGNLTLSKNSSNQNLAPDNNLVFGGSGANRNLTVTPAANQYGSSTITVTVTDAGGLTASDTFVLTVNSVNDAPAGTDNTVTANEDTPYTFAAANFGFTDPNEIQPNAFNRVKITTLPGAGTLKLSGNAVSAGDFVTVANIPNLTFEPALNGNGSPYTNFTFQVEDDGGTANGGVNLDQSANTLTINVTAVNDAPGIATIFNRQTVVDRITPEIGIHLSDVDSPLSSIVVTASFEPPNLVTGSFSGSEGVRSINITPATGQIGEVTVTLTATDNGSPPAQSWQQFTLSIMPNTDSPFGFDIGVAPTGRTGGGPGSGGGPGGDGGSNGGSDSDGGSSGDGSEEFSWPDLVAIKDLFLEVKTLCPQTDEQEIPGFTSQGEKIKCGKGEGCGNIQYVMEVVVKARLRKGVGDAAHFWVGGDSVGAASESGTETGCPMSDVTVTKTLLFHHGDLAGLNYEVLSDVTKTHGLGETPKIEVIDARITKVFIDGEECIECLAEANGQATTMNSSAHAYFKLGGSTFGEVPLRLELYSPILTAQLATPNGLSLLSAPEPGVSAIQWTNAIRQVKTPQGLVDVCADSSSQYCVRFYPTNAIGNNGQTNSSGLYVTNGTTPETCYYVISNPSENTNCLRIVEHRGGTTMTNQYDFTPAGGSPAKLELTKGNGLQWIRRQYETNGSVRTETVSTHATSGGSAVRKRIEKISALSFGEAVTETKVDPDSAALTTSYIYYTNSSDYGYGLLKQTVWPNGSWQIVEYNSNKWVSVVYDSYLNQSPTNVASLCRKIEYDYTPIVAAGDAGAYYPQLPRRQIEYVLGQEVRRRYFVYKKGEKQAIVCVNPGDAWNNSSNLVTITKRVDSGFFKDELLSVKRPDGTMTLYAYSTNATSKTTTVESGQANGAGTAVTNGTRAITIQGMAGQIVTNSVFDIASGILTGREIYSNFDLEGRAQRVDYLDGTFETMTYGCCGLESRTDREGVTTSYAYDALKRKISETRLGISTLYTYDAASRVIKTVRQGTDASQVVLSQVAYDLAGRLIAETNAVGVVTTYAESTDAEGQTVKTTTYAAGTTNAATGIETFAKDGSLLKRSGTAVTDPARYEFSFDGTELRTFTKEIKLDANGNDTPEWTKTYTDPAGRAYKTVHPDGAYSQSYFNTLGQLWKQRDPDGVRTLYQYNGKGEVEYSAIDMNQNDTVDLSGTDRITQTLSDVINNYSTTVRRNRTYVWTTDNLNYGLLTTIAESSTDGLRTWTTSYGLISTSVKSLPSGGSWSVTNTAPDGSKVIAAYQNSRLASVTRLDSSGAQLGATTYAYDAHGRQASDTDARNGTTTYAYDNADRVVSAATPLPGNGQNAQTTTSYFDDLGRAWKVVQPDGTTLTNEFFPTGLRKKKYGSREYPVEYTYDAQGRRTTMKTWTNFFSGTGAAVTTWNYQPNRGFLDNKRYPDNYGPNYTYTAAGRLQSRLWARGTTAYYAYNNAGELINVDYSDTTPDLAYSYDRRGRRKSVNHGAATTSLFFSDDGQLSGEAYSGGTLGGLRITNLFDSLLRRTTRALPGLGFSSDFTYDDASRLASVSDGSVHAAEYTYLANSALVSNIVFKQSGTTRMTTTKQYDKLNRLLSISSVGGASSASPISFSYQYNDANQRIRTTLANGSYWLYEYDKLGQVVSGKKYWADGTPVAGQQNEYAFDDIGNRTSTKAGGDANGANLRNATYTANNLNQYSSRTLPGAADVLGIANYAATVTVNSQATYRKGEYFWKELSVANGSAPQYTNVTVTAVNGAAASTNSGNLFVPQTPENFTYDLDGNLLTDGRWTYTWDGENRLTQAESLASGPLAAKRKVAWEYDGQGRRIRQTTSDGSSGSYVVTEDLKFMSDGWRHIAELNATNNAMVRWYVWGLDLSGSLDGAGGVGGLLAMYSAANDAHFYAMDGNGNVAALVKASDGTVSANYDYDPFGQKLRETGVMANENRFQFSTKRTDRTTDLVLYEYRPYIPSLGRWLNRDPIEEKGGLNLYGFVLNDPILNFDPHGLSVLRICFKDGSCRTIQDPTMADLIAALNNAITANNLVTILTLKGHASCLLIQLNKSEFLTTAGNKIITDSQNDLAAKFRGAMDPGGAIDLAGCQTGRCQNNIAKDFSLILPGIVVSGGAGLYQLGIPCCGTAIGKKNYFINGNLAHSTW